MIYTINKIFPVRIFLIVSSLFILYSCDKSITIPLDAPGYKPHLIIYGNASPQSGALVKIQYNQPIQAFTNELPELPSLEVYLLESGQKKYKLLEDSIGSFSLGPDHLNLKSEEVYSLWVRDKDADIEYQSSAEELPIQPSIKDIIIEADTSIQRVLMQFKLGRISESIEGYSINTSLLDSNLNNYTPLHFYNKTFNMEFPDLVTWEDKPVTLLINYEVGYDGNTLFFAPYSSIEVAYYSKSWALFAKDARQYFSFGEDVFQIVQPIYSNIPGNHGVFGLYNEVVLQVSLQ